LNRLFKKWTIPVRPIAISIGKNSINAGVRIVPRPKPEKKVRTETKKATIGMIMSSIYGILVSKIVQILEN
jgi:hypothetical protein